MQLDPEQIGRRLLAGAIVTDADFDAWLPEEQQSISYRFWTSVGVAMRVTRWLAEAGVERVLDVGSGVGKFCVLGALSSRMTFTGVEQRPHLVAVAEELALRFRVAGKASFVVGRLEAVDFRDFDGLYFYNPFGENRFPVTDHLDSTVEISRQRFEHDIAETERLLDRMPVGTHLATYNSYGGRVPDSFDLVRAKTAGINLLRLWRKARPEHTGGYWLELEDTTLKREPGQPELSLVDPQEAFED